MATPTGSKAGVLDVNDLRYFIRIFSKNWYLVVVAAILSSVLCYLYLYKQADVYGARTQILLKDRQTYNYQNQVYENIGYIAAYGDMVNQKRVLTSYDMVSKTLDKLDFDVSYYVIGRFKTSEMYEKRPFNVRMQLLNTRLYEKPFELKIVDAQTFEVTYDGGNGRGMLKKHFPFGKDVADEDFTLRVMKTSFFPSKIDDATESNYRFVLHSRNWLVAKYSYSMTVENIEYTSILQCTVEDEIATRAKLFLDSLSQVYIDQTLQSDYEINQRTLSYIDKQLDEVSVFLNSFEDDMEMYLRQKNILNLNKEEDRYFNELVNFDNQKRQYELMVESVDQLENYVLNLDAEEKLLPPSFYVLQNDLYLNNTLPQLYNMQMEVNNKLFEAKDQTNPGLVKTNQSINLTKSNILIYLTNTRTAIQEKISDVSKQIADYEDKIRTVPENQRGVLNIQRKVDVNEKLYEYLLEKKANTVIARAGILPTTKVIEAARDLGVVRPDKLKTFYVFLVGGVLLALVVVFIRVLFYDRLENADQLRAATPIPVFGEIISSEKAEQNYVVVDSDPKSAITESFRTVRTNLEYLPTTEKGKVVMVTSYRPNEGKTFCSVNLSAILAKAGKKVLLLELDLHKPKVATGLGMNSTKGLSNLLVGKADISECVMPTQIENFHVILSGPTPPNASELVLSKQLNEIFDYGRAHYDYVLVDTPPVGLITDALLMMRHVDATLFVINTRFANKDHMRNATEVAQSSGSKNFGFILNGVRMKKSKYYYNTNYGYGYRYAYGYGSGYGYGYGYGRKNRKKEDNGVGKKRETNQNT